MSAGATGSLLRDIVEVEVALDHSCALNSRGEVFCWGEGGQGELGHAAAFDSTSPLRTKGVGKGFGNSGTLSGIVQISLQHATSCALGRNGQVSCWGGASSNGQLGRGTLSSSAKRYPGYVLTGPNAPPLKGIVQVSVGAGHTCALTSQGKVWCWGGGAYGSQGHGVLLIPTGDPATSTIPYPVAVVDSSGNAGSTLSGVTQLSTGFAQTCALKTDGTVYCWGTGYLSGQNTIAYPWHLSALSDVSALTQPFGSIASASQTVKCALRTSGRAQCWGDNQAAQLTHGLGGNRGLTWIRANSSDNLTEIAEIRAGAEGACALLDTGTLKCWGQRAYAAIGGSDTTVVFPRPVLSDSSGTPFASGARSSHYVCRKNFSKCAISAVSLAPGGGQSNYIMKNAAPIISLYGLQDGQTLGLYSDATCSAAFSGAEVSGSSTTDPQSVTLSNAVTDRDVFLYYKLTGDNQISNSLCFKSPVILNRVAPPAPSGFSFPNDSSATVHNGEPILTAIPDKIRVAVTINQVGRPREHAVKVYFENSTCNDSSALIGQKNYYSNGNVDLDMGNPNYQWGSYDPLNAPRQPFRFYAQTSNSAGNTSACTESPRVHIPVPNPNPNPNG